MRTYTIKLSHQEYNTLRYVLYQLKESTALLRDLLQKVEEATYDPKGPRRTGGEA